MSCPPDLPAETRLRRAPDVAFRPIPEWRRALAYTPARPELVELNPTAWLIFALCDGRPYAAIAAEFAAATELAGGADAAGQRLAEGVAGLLAARLVVAEASA